MNGYFKFLSTITLCVCSLNASGYRIPEQSSSAVALSSANIAATTSADVSYYNPANMSWLDSAYHFEGSLNYIHLPKGDFVNSSKFPGTMSDKSLSENFVFPTLFLVSPEYKSNFRFGLSLVAPAGLAKRWRGAYASASAREFSLKAVELNPSLAYRVNDKLSLGFGLRAVYLKGRVVSDASGLAIPLSRDMSGDSMVYGYNLALSYKPIDNLKMAATYRSKVKFNVKGDADLNMMGNKYSGGASVSIPLPAVLDLALAYTINKTTLEFVYEREYWSSYKDLDFDYDVKLPVFDTPVLKNWEDIDNYRFGITHQYSDKLKLMGGFAYSNTPAPRETLGFELPDSRSTIYSAGFDYKISEKLSFGFAYLYSNKVKRSVDRVGSNPIQTLQGEFKNNSAHILNTSLKYRF